MPLTLTNLNYNFEVETFENFLTRLNLTEFKSLFESEKISMKNVLLLTESDLIKLGLSIGPRRQLLDELTNNSYKKERDQVEAKIKANLSILKEKESEQKKTNRQF